MKYFIKQLSKVIILVFILLFASSNTVSWVNNVENVEAATVRLNKTKIEIKVGETVQLKLIGTDLSVKWTSNNKKYASVSKNGLVTGVKSGTSYITATIGDKSYTCKVIVKYPTLNKSIFKAGIGDKLQLQIKDLPLTFSKSDIKYGTDNDRAAVVDENGVITALYKGYANISVTFGTYKLHCSVFVSLTEDNKVTIIDNLKIEDYELNGEIIYVIKNNNNINLTADCQLEFYDETNNLVSISPERYVGLFSGDEGIAIFQTPQKKYDHYKLKVDKIIDYYQINQKDKVITEITDKYDYTYEYTDWDNPPVYLTSDTIQLFDIRVDNQSGKRVSYDAYILYFKNNILINYTVINHHDLDIGLTIIEKPQIQNCYGKITIPEYDSCRIIYSAKTYE